MNHPSDRQPFIFHPSIDTAHLQSLYDYDYQWIEEIFHTALSHFDEDVAAVRDRFQADDLPGLKKAIHKIKPTFGFIGMPSLQEDCKAIEDKSLAVTSMNALQTDIETFLSRCADCKTAIQTDLQRLIQFNQPAG